MDTALSSSVPCTAIRFSTVLTRDAHHFKCYDYPATHLNLNLNLSSSLAPAPAPTANIKLNPINSPSSTSSYINTASPSSSQLLTSTPINYSRPHRNAATGYAAALIDVSQCSGSLQQVQQDVRVLSRMLQDHQIQGILSGPYSYHYKGLILKEIGKKLKFHKHLAALLRMLIDRKKMELISEVLGEFRRIYSDMLSIPLTQLAN